MVAARIGRPSAARAFGPANGANPIAIVFPCHRVIGAAGALTGYGGGSRESNGCWRTKGSTFRAAHIVIGDAEAVLKDNAVTHSSDLGEVIGNRNWTEVAARTA
jgi:alkylated DNA nucleotide flippase Atl1